jgi:hypothetical protein
LDRGGGVGIVRIADPKNKNNKKQINYAKIKEKNKIMQCYNYQRF